MRKINVFVSSTCYDLKQIRNDLKDFILSQGHNPMLSEESNFPINPQKGTVENCIDAVRNQADIFVLIIGNRYGMPLSNGRSITNMEFLTAVEKNIPIYTFTAKQIVSNLPIWKDNRDGNFSKIVDDIRIFEFVEDVRSKKFWNFEFETAQDITKVLGEQWSYLLYDALYYRGLFTKNDDYDTLYRSISPEALRIIVEKNFCYEIRFYLQCCIDEIHRHKNLKNDYTYSVVLQTPLRTASISDFAHWGQRKVNELVEITNSLNRLLQDAFSHFLAEPGTSSDLKGLLYVAQAYGRVYASLMKWTIDVRSLSVDDEYIECRNAVADMSKSVIEDIEKFPFISLRQVYEAEERVKNGESNVKINAILTLNFDEKAQQKFREETGKLRSKLSRGLIS